MSRKIKNINKMKIKNLLIVLISIAVSSCGGLESDVIKLAKKACECKKLKGVEKRDCKAEVRDMKDDIQKEIKDSKLTSSEERKLKELSRDTYKDCKGK
jgi:hypothetical protein